jgi:hypothetical protein
VLLVMPYCARVLELLVAHPRTLVRTRYSVLVRRYNVFKTYPDFQRLVRELTEVADGGVGRPKLPILGPNPYSVDFMDGDTVNQKIRLEFTLKRLTDVIAIITKCVVITVYC